MRSLARNLIDRLIESPAVCDAAVVVTVQFSTELSFRIDCTTITSIIIIIIIRLDLPPLPLGYILLRDRIPHLLTSHSPTLSSFHIANLFCGNCDWLTDWFRRRWSVGVSVAAIGTVFVDVSHRCQLQWMHIHIAFGCSHVNLIAESRSAVVSAVDSFCIDSSDWSFKESEIYWTNWIISTAAKAAAALNCTQTQLKVTAKLAQQQQQQHAEHLYLLFLLPFRR